MIEFSTYVRRIIEIMLDSTTILILAVTVPLYWFLYFATDAAAAFGLLGLCFSEKRLESAIRWLMNFQIQSRRARFKLLWRIALRLQVELGLKRIAASDNQNLDEYLSAVYMATQKKAAES